MHVGSFFWCTIGINIFVYLAQAGSISLSVLYLMCMATSLLGSAVPGM